MLNRRAFGAAAVLVALGVAADAPVRYPLRIRYGADPSQFGDLYLPHTGSSLPVVVMIHGGGWLQKYDLDYTGLLAQSLVRSGIAVWNIEYRRVGGTGGWPMTLADVDDATEALPTRVQAQSGGRLDLDRVHVAGHSAGGHLAAWLAGRHTFGPGAPGANPSVRIHGATTMAGVFDLMLAVTNGKDQFLRGLLGGGPDEVPDRYRIASPIDHLPIGLPLTAFHGEADRTVSVRQSLNYVAAATRLGDPATVRVIQSAGHGELADPRSPAWEMVRGHIVEALRTRA
ncbi:esterase [Rhodococcoides trifolii]|uniref:Esterase n=1 Tax=Rhodococcoides trifolii TaxID=908250 RepID=A0A917CUL0_9NOCA|nr:alpha/beta hydrolase [Rhodococcus trifolii]GGF98239.1 esterase [Rhodococcus trifolii]